MGSFSVFAPLLVLVVFVSLSETALSIGCQGNSCGGGYHKQRSVQKKPRSCLDHLKRGSTKCGIYPIYDGNDNGFPVYCDMKSEPGNAWTLVMSWKTAKRGLVQFQKLSFKQNGPVNENAPNFNLYRLTLARMQSLKSHSTHWRATCSFPVNGVDYRDYVRGNFKDFNIMTFNGNGACHKVEYVNIRGHIGIHTTVKWWQNVSNRGLHIDSRSGGCTSCWLGGWRR